MRTVSGRRNRIVLVLASIVFIAVGLWMLAPATGLRDRWPASEQFIPAGDTTVAALVTGSAAWLTPVALAVSVLLAIAAVLLLLAQIPTQPPHSTLRITDADDTVLGSVPPAVLERAMADALSSISGVESASVRVGGGSAHPWVQASATVSERAEAAWVVRQLRSRINQDVTTVLGVAPQSIDLLVGVDNGAKRSGGRVDAASA